MPSAGVKIQ